MIEASRIYQENTFHLRTEGCCCCCCCCLVVVVVVVAVAVAVAVAVVVVVVVVVVVRRWRQIFSLRRKPYILPAF